MEVRMKREKEIFLVNYPTPWREKVFLKVSHVFLKEITLSSDWM
jgi:hypothetical protein